MAQDISESLMESESEMTVYQKDSPVSSGIPVAIIFVGMYVGEYVLAIRNDFSLSI